MPDTAHHTELVCVEVLAESADVKTFWFERIDGQHFVYHAGQFITIEPEIDAVRVRRCYTLSSSPTQARGSPRASITVKAKPGGLVSNWLHAHLRIGTRLAALAPGGTFSIHDPAPEKYLFVAGGVGITPVISMARWLVAQTLAGGARGIDICFVQCARSEHDLLFTGELDQWARNGLVQSFPLPAVASSDWQGERGLITRDYLDRICPNWSARKIFCCGPDPFMEHVRALAELAGHDTACYHQERFSIDVPTRHPPAEPAAGPASIVLSLSGRVIEDAGNMSILEAVRTVDVEIPASCEAGICGTCKIRIHAGKVAMQHQGGIEDHEIEEGWALACCSRPLGRIEIGI